MRTPGRSAGRAPGVRSDTVRTAALVVAAGGVIAVPTLAPLVLQSREGADRYDTAITPPDYAFAIWAPIFAGIAANAVQAGLAERRRATDNRRTGWPLTAAYALNTAWSVAAQSGHFALTPVLLPAATTAAAVAHARLQHPGAPESIASVSTGLLLGWTSLASVVNLSAGTQLLGADPRSRRSVLTSSVALAGASGLLARAVARSRRGYLPLAAAAMWGLATTALDRRRTRTARLAAAGSSALVAGAALRQVLRQRRADPALLRSRDRPAP